MASTAASVRTDRHVKSDNHVIAAASVAWVVFAAAALIVLALAAHATPYFGFDLAVALAVQSIHAQWFDLSMQAVSWPGFPPQVYALIAAILALLIMIRRRWEAFCVAFASIFVGAVGLAIKVLVDRPRPSPALIHDANPALDGGKFSFTAGHVESFVAILGFLWFLAYISQHRSVWRTLLLILLAALIALIGLSRVYSGEHWLSDVIGGYLFGSIALILTVRLYEWGKTRFFMSERSMEAMRQKSR